MLWLWLWLEADAAGFSAVTIAAGFSAGTNAAGFSAGTVAADSIIDRLGGIDFRQEGGLNFQQFET